MRKLVHYLHCWVKHPVLNSERSLMDKDEVSDEYLNLQNLTYLGWGMMNI